MSQLGKVRKSNKLFKSTNLRICNLERLFVDRPPLVSRNNQYYKDWVGGNVGILQRWARCTMIRDPLSVVF
jgi:hypothetical protein